MSQSVTFILTLTPPWVLLRIFYLVSHPASSNPIFRLTKANYLMCFKTEICHLELVQTKSMQVIKQTNQTNHALAANENKGSVEYSCPQRISFILGSMTGWHVTISDG